MKNLLFIPLILSFILLSSCEKKIDLSTEIFDKKTYKSIIEKAYVDSDDKTDEQMLLTFINDNLEGKIDQTLKENGVSVEPTFKSLLENDSELTYQTILDEARLYTTFFNKTIEFNENLKKSLNLKFLKFTSDEYGSAKENLQFEAQNYGFLDIVEIKFIYSIYNKSGEEIHFGEGSSNTVAKSSNVKFEIDGYNPFAGEISNVVNMDMESLTFGIYIEEISFQDGSTLSRPQLE